MRLFILAVLVIGLSGCYSVGVRVKSEQLTQFKKGATTSADVEKALGKPTTKTLKSDGTTVWRYEHIHSQARPETFIPFVGGLVGGADTTMNAVNLSFNNGVLVDYESSESNIGGGVGLSSSGTTERTDQPRN